MPQALLGFHKEYLQGCGRSNNISCQFRGLAGGGELESHQSNQGPASIKLVLILNRAIM